MDGWGSGLLWFCRLILSRASPRLLSSERALPPFSLLAPTTTAHAHAPPPLLLAACSWIRPGRWRSIQAVDAQRDTQGQSRSESHSKTLDPTEIVADARAPRACGCSLPEQRGDEQASKSRCACMPSPRVPRAPMRRLLRLVAPLPIDPKSCLTGGRPRRGHKKQKGSSAIECADQTPPRAAVASLGCERRQQGGGAASNPNQPVRAFDRSEHRSRQPRGLSAGPGHASWSHPPLARLHTSAYILTTRIRAPLTRINNLTNLCPITTSHTETPI